MAVRPSDASVTNLGALQATDSIPIDRAGVDAKRKTTPADIETYLALGDAAKKDTGTGSGDVAAGDHNHSGTYAPAANGVTNGDSHDHSGGDGGQISYANLSNIPSTFTPASHTQAETTITFTDVTTNNASTDKHGFLPKLGGGTTNYLRADGTWATPAGSGSGTSLGLLEINITGDFTPINKIPSDANYTLSSSDLSFGSATYTYTDDFFILDSNGDITTV